MTHVFLNYRRADEPFGVALLDAELSARFGPDAVFFASKSIRLGADWEEEMFDAVKRSAALLAVIGRNWLDATDDTGRRRLDDPDDFVRREILTALDLGKNVIVVRLGTPRLSEADLPAELRPILSRQDTEIQYRTTGPDIDRLAAKLRRLIPELPAPRAQRPEPVRQATYRDNANHNEFHNLTVGTFHAGTAIHPDGGRQ